MRLNESFMWAFLENHCEGIYVTDTNRRIVFWNREAERITGYTAGAVMGSCCADNILIHVDGQGQALCSLGCPLMHAMSEGEPRRAEVYLHHKQGHRVPVTVCVTPIRDEHGQVIGAAEVFRDNATCQAEHEIIAELSRAALIDQLTGLPNRRHIEMHLAESFDQLRRYGLAFGIIFADIDRFKGINDTYGHAIGDEVLRMVSQTLGANIRASDIAGRWGGEEFLLIIRQAALPALVEVAEKLRMLVENSGLHHNQGFIRATVTMGAAVAREGENQSELIERADALLYEGKNAGRNRVVT